jgi:hypothetical protein
MFMTRRDSNIFWKFCSQITVKSSASYADFISPRKISVKYLCYTLNRRQGLVRPERLRELEYPTVSSGMKTATSRLVA